MPNAAALSQTWFQIQLSLSETFINRLRAQMLAAALTVKQEPLSTPNHAQRSAYANQVLANPHNAAAQAAGVIAFTANLIGTVNIVDWNVDTTATDAAILSQVTTSWSHLAGADTGS